MSVVRLFPCRNYGEAGSGESPDENQPKSGPANFVPSCALAYPRQDQTGFPTVPENATEANERMPWKAVERATVSGN
jgi:hypothetical protein